MTTMQEVCDKGRVPLNDADKDRFSDPLLLSYCKAGILEAQRIRPDFRFGSYGTPSGVLSLTLTDSFPLPDSYIQAIADYIVFRAETPSDESVDTQRAQTFMALFERTLTT